MSIPEACELGCYGGMIRSEDDMLDLGTLSVDKSKKGFKTLFIILI